MKFRIAGSIFASGAALSLLLSGAYGRNHGSLEEHKHVRGGDKSAKARVFSAKRHLDATKMEGGKFADQPRIQRRLEKIRRKRQLAGPFKRGVEALGGGTDENPTVDLAECSPNVLNDDQDLPDERGDTGLLSFHPDNGSDCDEGYACLPSTVSSRGGFCVPLKTTRMKATSARRVATDVNQAYPDCLVDDPSFLSDGFCDNYEPYNTAECGWDGGDCVVAGYPDCHVNPDWLGDGECDGADYNTAACDWDGGDCNADNARLWKTYPDCKGGVDPGFIGDDGCDGGAHNTAECGWDGGDCLIAAYPDCHVDKPELIGSGVCYHKYNTAECGWDGGDCVVAGYPDCHVNPDWLGDEYCDGADYNTAECGWDSGDCKKDNARLWKTYPDCKGGVDPSYIGDDLCDYGAYNTAECGWDGGDCDEGNAELWKTYPDCKGGVDPDYIGDDDCDGGVHNTAECGWDGGDCIEENKVNPPPGWPGSDKGTDDTADLRTETLSECIAACLGEPIP